RLSQLAALFSRQAGWCSLIREASRPEELEGLLSVQAGSYWDRHYTLGRPSSFQVKALGTPMRNNLVIKSFVPPLFAYGCLRDTPAIKVKALNWLEAIPAEKNAILKKWNKLGIVGKNACESQALLELKVRYCGPKRCLDCAAGKTLLSGIL